MYVEEAFATWHFSIILISFRVECYETIAWPRGALRPSPVWSACKNNQKTFQLKYDIVFNRNKTDFHTAKKITEVLVR